VDGTVRHLHNVMGLWLLQESQRTWAAQGLIADLPDLLAAAAQVPAFTAVVDSAAELSGREVEAVHLVRVGARNTMLCQLTADACGLPVFAGPVEAVALGNALVQARAAGAVSGGLAELRALLRHTQDVRLHLPLPGADRAWQAAEARVAAVRS
jgi:rhamnulokinase